MGYWEDQSKFARAIANNADSDADHYLAVELAQSIGRPDMGVMVGRRAVSSGLTGYGTSAFPRVPVPSEARSEEHTSELQSLMRISYAVFCLKKKNRNHQKSHRDTR